MQKIEFNKHTSAAIKGIAIIMMLMHHSFRNTSLFAGYEVSFWPFAESMIIHASTAFKICVSLFTFISGYGLYLSYKTRKESVNRWLIRRQVKLLSGYWFIFILSLIFCQYMDDRPKMVYFADGNWSGILYLIIDFFGCSNFFETNSLNGAWWYMSAAIMYITLIPVLIKLENHFLVLMSMVVFLPRVLGIDFQGSNASLSFLLIFIFGIYSAKYDLIVSWVNAYHKKRLHKLLKFILETVFIVFLMKLYMNIPENTFWEIKWAIIPLCIVFYCTEFITSLPLIRQVLVFLGKHSENIFLTHIFVIHYYYADFTYSFGHFVPIVIVSLLVCTVLSIAIEGLKKLIHYPALIQVLLTWINTKLTRICTTLKTNDLSTN